MTIYASANKAFRCYFFLNFANMQKRKKKHILHKYSIAVVMFLTIAFCAACTDDEVCEEVTANDLRIGFYIAGQDTETRAVFGSLTVFALENPDSLIYNRQNNVSVIELPLNPHRNQCTFVLDFNFVTDTIRLEYTREEHLISVECGFTMFFNIYEVAYTTNLIESLIQTNTYVTNSFDEHFKVYFPEPDIIIN